MQDLIIDVVVQMRSAVCVNLTIVLDLLESLCQDCETAHTSGDGRALAQQYSRAVAWYEQPSDDVTQLGAIKT